MTTTSERASYEFCLDGDTTTSIFAITGRGTAFSEKLPINQLAEDTILLIEVRDSHIHWMAPGDFVIDELSGMSPWDAGFGCRVAEGPLDDLDRLRKEVREYVDELQPTA